MRVLLGQPTPISITISFDISKMALTWLWNITYFLDSIISRHILYNNLLCCMFQYLQILDISISTKNWYFNINKYLIIQYCPGAFDQLRLASGPPWQRARPWACLLIVNNRLLVKNILRCTLTNSVAFLEICELLGIYPTAFIELLWVHFKRHFRVFKIGVWNLQW